jgi:hypothetical protein
MYENIIMKIKFKLTIHFYIEEKNENNSILMYTI